MNSEGWYQHADGTGCCPRNALGWSIWLRTGLYRERSRAPSRRPGAISSTCRIDPEEQKTTGAHSFAGRPRAPGTRPRSTAGARDAVDGALPLDGQPPAGRVKPAGFRSPCPVDGLQATSRTGLPRRNAEVRGVAAEFSNASWWQAPFSEAEVDVRQQAEILLHFFATPTTAAATGLRESGR